MSLLNDMLRDLSYVQKHANATSASQADVQHENEREQLELLRHSSVVKAEKGKLWPSVIVFCLVLVLFAIWNWALWGAGNSTDQSEIANTQKIETVPVQHTAEFSQEKTDTSLSTIDNSIENGSNKSLESNHEKTEITVVSDSSEILNDRLAALENAITRLSNVVEESKVPVGQKSSIASGEAEIAGKVAESDTTIGDVSGADSVIATQHESVSIRDPFVASPVEKTRPIALDDDHIPADAHLSIAPNTIFVDQRQAERGRQLFAQGQMADAIIELQSFIAKADMPRESAKALLDIFTAQENVAAMETLLDSAHYLNAVDKNFYAAKAAVIQHREDYAVELLETHLAEGDVQEGYRAFLAGLYQRTGKYSEAANSYRRLLGNFGEKPAYWLGFALAQDSLNQPQVARQAYLRLAEYPDLQPQVRTYIQQRIAALQ